MRGSWVKLRRYVERCRESYGNPNWGEWFQWLAERLDGDPAPGTAEGAHVAFRSWRRA